METGAHGRSRVRCMFLISVLYRSLAGSLISAENNRPKNVQVSLQAKWAGTPFLLEAGELLSKHQKDLFWEFISLWLEPDKGSECLTAAPKKMFDGKSFLSESLGAIFEFSLTLRSASPKLVLYRQLAEESLSSFPIEDEPSLMSFTQVMDQSNKVLEGAEARPSHTRLPARTSRARCCWVDTGSTLLFNAIEN